jgi:pimeloyl-ACP methyl ester carboxylesterase
MRFRVNLLIFRPHFYTDGSIVRTSTVKLLADSLTLSLIEEGKGPAVLLLHPGAGPTAMRPLVRALSGSRVLLPTHPGFDGTPCPMWCRRIADLATIYLALIERLELGPVTVVGNSMGGWIAAELAASGSPAIAGAVILDGVGLTPTASTGPITDPNQVPPAELPALVYANPARFAKPATSAVAPALPDNREMLKRYAGDPFFCDATLPQRLAAIRIPVLVLWGEADRIVTPAYGRALAGAIPGSHFELIADAGHFPQIEQIHAVVDAMDRFTSRYRKS